jgi:hypothetical protein
LADQALHAFSDLASDRRLKHDQALKKPCLGGCGMRVINALFSLVLILFALVQYNDPDFLFWFSIYALAAAWCAMAAFKPGLLATSGPLRGLFIVCLLAAGCGTGYFWPIGEAWWAKDVIWDNELVREGLGMAIVMIGLLLAALAWWRSGRSLHAAG